MPSSLKAKGKAAAGRGTKKTKHGGSPASVTKRGLNVIADLDAEAERMERRRVAKDKLCARELDIKLEGTKLEARKLELEAESRAHEF